MDNNLYYQYQYYKYKNKYLTLLKNMKGGSNIKQVDEEIVRLFYKKGR